MNSQDAPRSRVIPLSQDMTALVSPEDYRRVVKRKWSVAKRRGRIYAETNMKIDGVWKRVLLHRFILEAPAGQKIDHKDGNGLNNLRDNIRFATHNQNAQNAGRRVYMGKRSSRFKGISWSKVMNKWHAQIMANRKYHNLGYFESEEDAARAYDSAAKELHGEFARTNF